MFRILCRSFHCTKASLAPTGSILAKLRKSTGYPLSNCKKALELFPEDVVKAEEWLHAEAKNKGWSKLAKIQTRSATQGLIGVCSRDNVGVMVEVNCETDFVSRNAEFQQIVEKMLSGCIRYATNLKVAEGITKEVLDESQLNAIPCESSTLGELVTSAMCKFNERTVAKRAVCLKTSNETSISSLSHPATICLNLSGASLGKYGVLLASKKSEIDSNIPEDIASLKQNICQHIIGMNPLSVGQLTEKDIARFLEKSSENLKTDENMYDEQITESIHFEKGVENLKSDENIHYEQNTKSIHFEKAGEIDQSEHVTDKESTDIPEESPEENPEMLNTQLKESSETQLLFQSYLMEPNITVGETLFKSGIEILAFERFECGEMAEEQQDTVVAASG